MARSDKAAREEHNSFASLLSWGASLPRADTEGQQACWQRQVVVEDGKVLPGTESWHKATLATLCPVTRAGMRELFAIL